MNIRPKLKKVYNNDLIGTVMNIVQNINKIIENTPYTLTELERMCGFPKSSMRKWSENIPSITKVAKVSEILNVSLDYLIFGKEKNSSSELPEEEQKCLNAFHKLSPNDRIEFIARMEQRYEDYPPELKESV